MLRVLSERILEIMYVGSFLPLCVDAAAAAAGTEGFTFPGHYSGVNSTLGVRRFTMMIFILIHFSPSVAGVRSIENEHTHEWFLFCVP
uniref:Putative secreted protein n=1 Tax=Anopheles darlingi TaxID=43151 RepID=A0A2M4DAT9_ANODA